MNIKRLKVLVSSVLVATSIMCTTQLNVFAKDKDTVTLGADLTSAQKTEMLKYFGVNKNDVNVIEITNQDIREQLGMDQSKPIPKNSVSISSSFVKVSEKGHGINVKSNNLTEVTNNMLSNALLTSGVTDAEVVASAPYKVTGTAALAGVLKGFEKSTGQELSLEKKETARDEINTTKNLGDKVGKEQAASIVNDVKTEVIKDKPKDDKAIEKIVNNVTNNYNVNLDKTQKEELVTLMSKINELDLNYSSLKDSLSKLGTEMKDSLKEAGVKIEESGFFGKVFDKIGDIFNWIGDELKGLFGSKDATTDKNTSKTDNKNSDQNILDTKEPSTEKTDTTK